MVQLYSLIILIIHYHLFYIIIETIFSFSIKFDDCFRWDKLRIICLSNFDISSYDILCLILFTNFISACVGLEIVVILGKIWDIFGDFLLCVYECRFYQWLCRLYILLIIYHRFLWK